MSIGFGYVSKSYLRNSNFKRKSSIELSNLLAKSMRLTPIRAVLISTLIAFGAIHSPRDNHKLAVHTPFLNSVQYSVPKNNSTLPSSFPKKSLDDELLKVAFLAKEGRISEVEKLTYKRIMPFIGTIERMEYLLGPLSYDFKYKVGAESDFNPNVISSAGAVGLSQLMPVAIKEMKRKMGIDSKIVNELFSKEKIDIIHINEDLSEIDKEIRFEELEFDNQRAEKICRGYNIDIAKIKNVILPRYILLKRIFPHLTLDEEKARRDPNYNLKVGYAVHISNKLELGTLQMIKMGSSIKFIHRPFNYFAGENENLRAFNKQEIDAAYNWGVYAMKSLALEKAKGGIFYIMPYVPDETKKHSIRIKEYKNRFENLQKNNLLEFQLDEIV